MGTTVNLDNRWLLPEGVTEVLPPQAWQLEQLRRRVLDLYAAWGYELVMPPLIEYLSSLLIETGDDLDLETFKITDQLSGRMMGIRADITPQAARIDAHHLQTLQPVRLCYLGDVIHTRPDGYFNSRIPLQTGIELYGHSGVQSDLEVLLLMLETLRLVGIDNSHIDLGHVGIFRALAKQAQLSCSQEAVLFDALQRKARPEIQALLSEFSIDPQLKEMLGTLADLNGDISVLSRARACLVNANQQVQQALQYLEDFASVFIQRCPTSPLYFDLAELRGYHYQTGVVFAAFVSGHGQEICRGGRYDEIGSVFGRARPATGFSADLKTLMTLGTPQVPGVCKAIFAPAQQDSHLFSFVDQLRARGEKVIYALPGQVGSASDMGCDREIRKSGDRWTVVSLTQLR